MKTMLTVTQNTRPGKACAIAAYQALSSMLHLMRTGNSAERRALLDQLVENNALEICLDVSAEPSYDKNPGPNI